MKNETTSFQSTFFRRTLLFWCCLLGIILSGSTQIKAQITGPTTVCSGVATVYNLAGTPNPSYTYTWSVLPSANSTILTSSPTSSTIQWFNTTPATEIVQVVITRPSMPNITWQLTVNIVPEPDPQISTSSKVGCQGVKGERPDKPGGAGKEEGIIIDDGACVKVCANSTVQYDVLNGQVGSTFQWTVDPLKATFSGPSTGTTVFVNWSNTLGFTFLKVKETTTAGCVKEKTICIEIIESPQPLFSVNGDIYPVTPPCFEACINANIQFGDLTPNPTSSPIVSWQWDFGDGTYSSLQNPTHIYTTPGVYNVVLIATNQCGCKGRYKVCINVQVPNNPPLEISCPSIVCENAIGHYTIANTCGAMFWTVNGGTIISSTLTSIDIMWDNVGPDGFGEIIADFSSCGGNCGPKVTAKVPVIQAIGTIQGKVVICSGKQYKYQLPKWPATNFKWTIIPSGAAVISGFDQNSHEVNLVGNSNFTLHCEYVNTMELCAGKADLNITVVQPITLSAPSKICKGDPFSIVGTSPPSVGTTYTFIDPNGITSTSGNFNITGTWTIQASNPAYCDIEPISVQVVDPPAAVSSISGDQIVCLNTPYVYEALTPIPNTLCNWVISGGTIITNSGNAVTVNWTSTTGPWTLSVSRSWADVPGCNSAAININVTKATPAATISGNTTPCANTNVPYTATLSLGSSPIDNIFWSLSNTNAGSISAGQNTMTPTITWNNTTVASTPVTITATLTKCGTTVVVNYPVTVIGIPTVSLSVSDPTPCSGTPVIFTATTIPAGATVNWTLPAGSTPPTVPTGSTATVSFTNVGLASQNFTVIATASASGCLLTGTASSTIAVKPQPNINVSPGSGPSSTIVICPPTSVNLLLSTNSTTSIDWFYNGAGSPYASGVTSSTVSAAGTYRVDVTNSFGCLSSVTRTIVHSCSPGCTLPAGAGITSMNHNITSCANSAGEALIDVNFNGILGSYLSGPNPVVTSLTVSGTVPYFTLPTASISFPNVSLTGITATKPGVYPVTLEICYQTSGTPCCTLVTENVIVPVIADFDYITNCVSGGYTLSLNDQSPILSGYTLSSQTWNTTGSGPTTSGSTINLSLYTPGSTLTITNTVTVTGPGGPYTCTRTRTYTVPAVPNPAFSISTTDPLGPNVSTCALREVSFTHLNTTGVSKWSWDFGDATGFISTTSNLSTRTYTNPAATYSTNVILTIEDAFGCTYNASLPITIYKNTFVLDPTNTYVAQEDIKCQGTSSSVTLVGVTGGYGSNSYVWYDEDVLLTGYSGNPISVVQGGLYWTMVTDARGCMQAGNPTPAKRAFQPLPDVAITGEHDFCPNEPITLSAANGTTTGITYVWEQLIGMTWVPVGSAAVFTIPGGLSAGVYQYRVNATQNLPTPYSGACTATSPVYLVTVHPNPNAPVISGPFAVNCANYSIQLNVSGPVPGEVYNWSNGTSGTSTIVNHGGAYRVWASTVWGCKSHSDIDVPMEPSFYFWRFPYGCYEYCRLQLPRRVDGPSYVSFTAWKWFIGAGGLPFPNGPWAGAGIFSVVDPLNIDLIPPMGGTGNGSGIYSWFLDNGLCAETSHTMSVNLIPDCCELDASLAYLRCEILPGSSTSTYYGAINVGGTGCSGATYTIYAVDPVTGLANGTVLPASGLFTGGPINFSYTPFPGATNVRFKVVITCDGKDCIARDVDVHLDDYPCRDMEPCDMETKWNYFHCVGGSSPYFAGGVMVNNTMGCAPVTYTIIAVDPGTGLPNGIVTPATGTLPSGWSSISFNYHPNPGVTDVKFLIILSCKDMICYSLLGEYHGIDNRDDYPCKDSDKALAKKAASGADKLSEGAVEAKMLIAPNPANGNVKISFNLPEWKQGDQYKISILNLLGQSVAEYDVESAQGAWQYTTLKLSSGAYLVRLVKDGANVDVQRMIIAH